MKNKIFKQNKRGDVPVVILVIGVLAICILAIVSFYISDRAAKKGFDQIGLVDKVVIEHEKIAVYTAMGMGQSEIDKILNVETDIIEGRYIHLEQGSLKVRYGLGK